MKRFLKEAAAVVPSARQRSWFEKEFYAFVHYGPNTYSNREWGDGKESPESFCPDKLDCDQWVAAIKSAHMKGMVLTAKHHDGFCLWPSRYTEHSVKHAPGQIDVVKAAAEACRKGGIAFGFYLSPWDRHSPLYGTDAYNDYFCNQLTELLTQYGEIFYVWFDNACGEGPNGIQQRYDFPRYIRLIRKYQPNAVIFNDFGPDVRWCGNEAGTPRPSEWAVVPGELCHYSRVQTGAGPMAAEGDLSYLYSTNQNIGSLDNILYSKGLTFTPAEINLSIRPGWFWHPEEEPHSLERLFHSYLNAVGANACFHLNIPPTPSGLFDPRDVRRLKELGDCLDQAFGHELPATTEKLAAGYPTQPQYLIRLSDAEQAVNYIVLREDLTKGQRVESFQIEGIGQDGSRFPFYQGTVIGNRKICRLTDPFREQNPLTQTFDRQVKELLVHITSARDQVFLKDIQVF